jgi:hypothetical protein
MLEGQVLSFQHLILYTIFSLLKKYDSRTTFFSQNVHDGLKVELQQANAISSGAE